jgi:aspartyl-tRNA(Asn)/glutamyl-tRNA(Gln) amidotransferase subunit B
MWQDINIPLLDLAKELEILQHSDQSFVSDIALQVVNQFPDKVKAYKSGKKGLIGFFMGQAMKTSKGKANPQILQKEIESVLNS